VSADWSVSNNDSVSVGTRTSSKQRRNLRSSGTIVSKKKKGNLSFSVLEMAYLTMTIKSFLDMLMGPCSSHKRLISVTREGNIASAVTCMRTDRGTLT
jgi:hypothetical protein